ERDGFVTLGDVFSGHEALAMRSALESALAREDDPAIRGDDGAVYAARNVLVLWPLVASVWKKEPLADALRAGLGDGLGLVRVLDGVPVQTLHAGLGDVLLIRPLVAHCSNRSHPGTTRHRRILHLEFAARSDLPDGYEWHDFVR